MSEPFHIYEERYGDHLRWEVDLERGEAAFCHEGATGWRVLRTHEIRRAAEGWEYYEDEAQTAERIRALEDRIRRMAALPLDKYPADARSLEAAKLLRTREELGALSERGPAWVRFSDDANAALEQCGKERES